MWKYILTVEYINLQNGINIKENTWEFKTLDALHDELEAKRAYWCYLGYCEVETNTVSFGEIELQPKVALIKSFYNDEKTRLECMSIFRVYKEFIGS